MNTPTIEHPERFKERFKQLLFNIKNNPIHYEHLEGKEIHMGDAYLTKRDDTIYLVPTEAWEYYKKNKKNLPTHQGFTMLASSSHNLRLCCFLVNMILYDKAVL
ncbi:MAG: hypothetical protein Q7R96_04005 [Nanoarchaeota archaeon]|nr:hypothetical protein [Nanoarchaeota archaeon]